MRIAALLIAVGCGGSKPAPSQPSMDCEPGRCLSDISRVIGEKKPAARACYEAGLKRVPEIKGGQIIINFDIDPEGAPASVTQSSKSDQIEDAEVVACVTDVVKQLKFPKSAKGKTTHAYHAFEFGNRARM
jgi:hypothetical protein